MIVSQESKENWLWDSRQDSRDFSQLRNSPKQKLRFKKYGQCFHPKLSTLKKICDGRNSVIVKKSIILIKTKLWSRTRNRNAQESSNSSNKREEFKNSTVRDSSHSTSQNISSTAPQCNERSSDLAFSPQIRSVDTNHKQESLCQNLSSSEVLSALTSVGTQTTFRFALNKPDVIEIEHEKVLNLSLQGLGTFAKTLCTAGAFVKAISKKVTKIISRLHIARLLSISEHTTIVINKSLTVNKPQRGAETSGIDMDLKRNSDINKYFSLNSNITESEAFEADFSLSYEHASNESGEQVIAHSIATSPEKVLPSLNVSSKAVSESNDMNSDETTSFVSLTEVLSEDLSANSTDLHEEYSWVESLFSGPFMTEFAPDDLDAIAALGSQLRPMLTLMLDLPSFYESWHTQDTFIGDLESEEIEVELELTSLDRLAEVDSITLEAVTEGGHDIGIHVENIENISHTTEETEGRICASEKLSSLDWLSHRDGDMAFGEHRGDFQDLSVSVHQPTDIDNLPQKQVNEIKRVNESFFGTNEYHRTIISFVATSFTTRKDFEVSHRAKGLQDSCEHAHHDSSDLESENLPRSSAFFENNELTNEKKIKNTGSIPKETSILSTAKDESRNPRDSTIVASPCREDIMENNDTPLICDNAKDTDSKHPREAFSIGLGITIAKHSSIIEISEAIDFEVQRVDFSTSYLNTSREQKPHEKSSCETYEEYYLSVPLLNAENLWPIVTNAPNGSHVPVVPEAGQLQNSTSILSLKTESIGRRGSDGKQTLLLSLQESASLGKNSTLSKHPTMTETNRAPLNGSEDPTHSLVIESDTNTQRETIHHSFNPCTKSKRNWADYDSDSTDSVFQEFLSSFEETTSLSQSSPAMRKQFNRVQTVRLISDSPFDLKSRSTSLSSDFSLEPKYEILLAHRGTRISLDELFDSATSMSALVTASPSKESYNLSKDLSDIESSICNSDDLAMDHNNANDGKPSSMTLLSNERCERLGEFQAIDKEDDNFNSPPEKGAVKVDIEEMEDVTEKCRRELFINSQVWKKTELLLLELTTETSIKPHYKPKIVRFKDLSSDMSSQENTLQISVNEICCDDELAQIDNLNCNVTAQILRNRIKEFKAEFNELVKNYVIPCDKKIGCLITDVVELRKAGGELFSLSSGLSNEISTMFQTTMYEGTTKFARLKKKLRTCRYALQYLDEKMLRSKHQLIMLEQGFRPRIAEVADAIDEIGARRKTCLDNYSLFFEINSAENRLGTFDIDKYTQVNQFESKTLWHLHVDLYDLEELLSDNIFSLSRTNDSVEALIGSIHEIFNTMEMSKTLEDTEESESCSKVQKSSENDAKGDKQMVSNIPKGAIRKRCRNKATRKKRSKKKKNIV